MRCPKCGSTDNRANNTRHNVDRTMIRRQRKCQRCGRIWYTVEKDEFSIESEAMTKWARKYKEVT